MACQLESRIENLRHASSSAQQPLEGIILLLEFIRIGKHLGSYCLKLTLLFGSQPALRISIRWPSR
jgi:hypothetical protein